MPKPRVLQKYAVDESRCILCGICVDACPYDALRDGAEFELSHTGRAEPEVDLIALAAIDRETEVTYIRRESDWAARAMAEGRSMTSRLLPVLPPSLAQRGVPVRSGDGNGHGNGHGSGHGLDGGSGHDHGHGQPPALSGGSGHAGPAQAGTPHSGGHG
jgi:ferredoxin